MAQKKVIVDLDFGGNKIIKVTLDGGTELPSATLSHGRLFCLTADAGTNPKGVYYYNGTTWVRFAQWDEFSSLSTVVNNHTQALAAVSAFMDGYTSVKTAVETETKTNLKMGYVKNDKKVYLAYKGTPSSTNNFASIDVTDFIKDGMLDSVELVTTAESGVTTEVPYLKFTFNTESGKSIIRVSVKGLVDIYGVVSTGGLSMSGKNFQIKLPSISGLKTDANGLAIKLVANKGLELVANGLQVKTSGKVTVDANGIHLTDATNTTIDAAETARQDGGIASKNYVKSVGVQVIQKVVTISTSSATQTAGLTVPEGSTLYGVIATMGGKDVVVDWECADNTISVYWNTTGLTNGDKIYLSALVAANALITTQS